MEHSESIKNIAGALRKFQGEIGPVAKTATNPFFKSKYAPLENVIEHIQEVMVRHGLSYSQFPDNDGLATILMHESGEWMKGTMKVHIGTKPQDHGAALTYARRYALSAVLGLATEDDNDGHIEPQKATVASKTAPRTQEKATDKEMAAKDRIMAGLKQLKAVYGPRPDKMACVKAVKDLTGLDLEDTSLTNLEAIGEALWAKIEQREAKN